MEAIDWPFRADEALEARALTFRELRRFHSSVYPGVLAGLSASALLGTKWIEAEMPAELIYTNRRAPSMLSVHSDVLAPGETQTLAGMTATTPARTAFDLGRRLELADGLQRVDALMNATDMKVADVEAVIATHPGARGLVQLRQTLEFADGGAESPYESLTRLLLIEAGFPRPQTQIRVLGWDGFVWRIDLGWPEFRVGVDFDGAHHWSDSKQRSRDTVRYWQLPQLGWVDIRLTSGILHNRPQMFLDRVGAALVDRGCPKTW